MKTGVYRFTCGDNGCFYIGSAVNIAKRKRDHLRALRAGTHINVRLQRVFNKYGENSFEFHVIYTDSEDEARSLEQRLLNKHHGKSKCMNISNGAKGGNTLLGHPNSAAIRKRIAKKVSQANTGNQYNAGRPKSEAHRQKISDFAKTRTGERNAFFGKQHSDKTKRRLARVAKQRAESGILPSNTLRVKIGKTVYRSASEAAKYVGCRPATILNRIRSDKFPEYKFA